MQYVGYIVEDETINTLIANKLQEIKDVKSYTFMEIEKDRFLINKCNANKKDV